MDFIAFGPWALIGGIILVYIVCDFLLRIPRLRNLNKRHVVITGCDTGFGCLAAQRLDALGCHVFAGCLTEKGESELRKQCSDRLKTFHLDVTSEASVRKAFQYVKSNLPPNKGVWALLNNAGISGRPSGAEWLPMAEYRKVCDVNLFGLVDVTLTFLPLIKKARGRIVNTASVMGRFCLPGIAPYAISKFGVEGFSDNIRRQLLPFRTSVHIIEPGYFATNITDFSSVERQVREAWQNAPADVRQEYGEDYLLQVLERTQEFLSKANPDVGAVVGAYVHAVTALFPRPRYVVGADAKFFYVPLSYLPEWLGDCILDILSKTPIPAACNNM